MTIVIGQAFVGGVLVGADTLVIRSDGSSTEGTKVTPISGPSGEFIFGNASDDLDATRTMANRIFRFLGENISGLVNLEDGVSSIMTEWAAAFRDKPPASELVLAVKLVGDTAKLYRCAPPNTFLEISEGYVAAGAGSGVTDPLHDSLMMAGLNTLPIVLKRFSYLMYRAKKDNALCGKRTGCYIIKNAEDGPLQVNILDLLRAEKFADQMDFLLQTTSAFYLGGAPEDVEKNAQSIAGFINTFKSFRTATFHDSLGREL